MIDWLVELAKETATFNSLFGIILYWVPVSLCLVGYTIRTGANVRADRIKRSRVEAMPTIDASVSDSTYREYYHPTDTIGSLVGRAIVSVIPIANLWAALFDVAPFMFGNFFIWIAKVLDQPLVPRKQGE
jgi:hypothetical protein